MPCRYHSVPAISPHPSPLCGAFWRPHDDALSGSSLMHRCASAASVPALLKLSPPISTAAPFGAHDDVHALSGSSLMHRCASAASVPALLKLSPPISTAAPFGAHDDVHALSGSSLMHRCASAASVPAPGVLKRARLKIGCDAHRARRALESYPPLVSSPSSPSQL